MPMNPSTSRIQIFASLAQSGTRADIDQLMAELSRNHDIATSKVIDYALSLVNNREGIAALRTYLFQGDQIQRNFAALFFKRKGRLDMLDEAVAQGKIDEKQAYLK